MGLRPAGLCIGRLIAPSIVLFRTFLLFLRLFGLPGRRSFFLIAPVAPAVFSNRRGNGTMLRAIRIIFTVFTQLMGQITPAKKQTDQDKQEDDRHCDQTVQYIGQKTDVLSLCSNLRLQLLDRVLRVFQRIAVHLHIARILCLDLALHHFRIDRDCRGTLVCSDRFRRIHRTTSRSDIQDILDGVAALTGNRDNDCAGPVRIQGRPAD